MTLLFFGQTSVSAASPRPGDICKKLGASSGSGMKRIVCGYVTQLRWQASPVKPPVGTIFNPVSVGATLSTPNFAIRVNEIDFNIGSEICLANPFNEGCRIDSKLAGEIDLNSSIRWVAINVNLTNKGKYSLQPGGSNFSYYLVLSDNNLIENSTTPVFQGNIGDLSLNPGDSGKGKIVFALPKEAKDLNPILIMRDESGAKIADYYLLLNW